MRGRRAEDRSRPHFVDRFPSTTFTLVLLLIVASLVDAVLTIQLINAGAAEEANPLMSLAIEHGVSTFLVVKYLMTVSGLPLLLIFQNHYLFHSRLRIGYLIPVAVLLYIALICYQLTLMHHCIPPL